MQKLVLMSIMIATIAIPIRLAGLPDAQAALRRTLVYAVVFHVIYCLLLLFVYGRFS